MIIQSVFFCSHASNQSHLNFSFTKFIKTIKLPRYNAVSQMLSGTDPTTALQRAMAPIIKYYPTFRGAMIAVNMRGKYGMYITYL